MSQENKIKKKKKEYSSVGVWERQTSWLMWKIIISYDVFYVKGTSKEHRERMTGKRCLTLDGVKGMPPKEVAFRLRAKRWEGTTREGFCRQREHVRSHQADESLWGIKGLEDKRVSGAWAAIIWVWITVLALRLWSWASPLTSQDLISSSV